MIGSWARCVDNLSKLLHVRSTLEVLEADASNLLILRRNHCVNQAGEDFLVLELAR